MPLPAGTKYRYKKGTKIRLAFNKKGEVIETKNMKTGKVGKPKPTPNRPRRGRKRARKKK